MKDGVRLVNETGESFRVLAERLKHTDEVAADVSRHRERAQESMERATTNANVAAEAVARAVETMSDTAANIAELAETANPDAAKAA